MKTISSPHRILFTFGVLLLLFGAFHSWLLSDLKTVDIQFHDTYFVLSNFHLYVFISILITLIGLVYWSFRKWKLNKVLSSIHIIVVMVSLVVFITVVISENRSRFIRHYASDTSVLDMIGRNCKTIVVDNLPFLAIALFLFAQLLLVINLVLASTERN